MRVGFGVIGVSVADVASEGTALVSRVRDEPFTSFFDDWLPSRRKAFQLGALGPGEDGLCKGVCSLRLKLW